VLRLLAASLLSDSKIKIQNYPSGLLDAQIHIGMLDKLGKFCELLNDDTVKN
jgi:UDP-N-acetylglucosamine 1-carboxyvinyltransferase